MQDYRELISKIKPELEKVVSFFENEVSGIRTGRANPSLVENIIVECFGQKFPLKQLAAISCPAPREIVVQPWDKSYLEPIEKAILQSNLRVSPVIDKDVIRIVLPSLTEEYRKELIRLLAAKQEEARRTIRRWREEVWSKIQTLTKEGEIREDDKFRAKDELQDLVDEYNEKIKEIGERKAREIED